MGTPVGKKYLYIAIIIALLALSYAVVAYIGAFKNSIDPSFARSFSVSGEGEVVAIPDIAQFSFTVITEGGEDIDALQKENTEKANAIIAFLKDNGIDDKDIKTQRYDVSPRYQYYDCSRLIPLENETGESCPPPEIVGFAIRQTAQVKSRDFETTGDLLAGAVERGANSVSQLQFTIDDPSSVEQEAREEAIKKAQAKAKATAKAGGFRLGRILSLNEGGGFIPAYKTIFFGEARDSGTGSAAPGPSIEPGSQKITVTVTLTYEIK